MGQPITLYTANGYRVTVHGRHHAAEMVEAGLLFWEQPAPDEPEAVGAGDVSVTERKAGPAPASRRRNKGNS